MSSQQTSRIYEYSPLPEGDHFRYLVLQPGANDDLLRCSLVVSTLSDLKTPFEAISYVWGNDVKDHEIICDGCTISITASLYEVLTTYRLQDESRNLWADSICINQNDMDEKSKQVADMGRIYSAAERVLIHITGDDHGYAVHVASLTKDISDWIHSVIPTLGTPIPWDSFPKYEPGAPILKDPRWPAMRALLYHPWFIRGWVVQEAALSRTAVMNWNRTEIDWHDFMITKCWLQTKAMFKPSETGFLHTTIAHFKHFLRRHDYVARLFRPEWSMSQFSLIECIDDHRQMEVSDPRDYIYAVMNMPYLDDEERIIVRPNYASDVSEIFKEFAIEHIRKTQTPAILDYVTTLEQRKHSWVPQWHRLNGAMNWPLGSQYGKDKAALSSRTKAIKLPVIIDESILRVEGVVFDVVHYASKRFTWTGQEIPPATMFLELQHEWNVIESSSRPRPYESTWLLDIFLKTIIVGRCSFMNSMATVYRDLLRHSLHPGELAQPLWIEMFADNDRDGFCFRALGSLSNRKLILTQRGYIGLAPNETQIGDSCGIVFGCKMPLILRKADCEDKFFCIGSTYITGSKLTDVGWGVMDYHILGSEESKDWTEWDDVEEQEIDIC